MNYRSNAATASSSGVADAAPHGDRHVSTDHKAQAVQQSVQQPWWPMISLAAWTEPPLSCKRTLLTVPPERRDAASD